MKPIVDVRFLAWPIARQVDDRADRVKEWRMRRYQLEDGSLIHVGGSCCDVDNRFLFTCWNLNTVIFENTNHVFCWLLFGERIMTSCVIFSKFPGIN